MKNLRKFLLLFAALNCLAVGNFEIKEETIRNRISLENSKSLNGTSQVENYIFNNSFANRLYLNWAWKKSKMLLQNIKILSHPMVTNEFFSKEDLNLCFIGTTHLSLESLPGAIQSNDIRKILDKFQPDCILLEGVFDLSIISELTSYHLTDFTTGKRYAEENGIKKENWDLNIEQTLEFFRNNGKIDEDFVFFTFIQIALQGKKFAFTRFFHFLKENKIELDLSINEDLLVLLQTGKSYQDLKIEEFYKKAARWNINTALSPEWGEFIVQFATERDVNCVRKILESFNEGSKKIAIIGGSNHLNSQRQILEQYLAPATKGLELKYYSKVVLGQMVKSILNSYWNYCKGFVPRFLRPANNQ